MSTKVAHRYERDLLTSDDGKRIHVYTWAAERPCGVLQLTPDLGECALRYSNLAEALSEAGWTVVAHDHRGHDAAARSDRERGQIGSGCWCLLVSDIVLVMEHSSAFAIEVPLVLLGHKMGWFAVEQVLPSNSKYVDGVVLAGTVPLGLRPTFDVDAPSNTACLDDHFAHPMTGFGDGAPPVRQLFGGPHRDVNPAQASPIRADLPIYVAVGEADGVNGQKALLRALATRYASAGVNEVEIVAYPDAMHELADKTCLSRFTRDLIDWLNRRMPRREADCAI